MSGKDWGVNDPEETYWFNTLTNLVEHGPQSLGIDRIGPFGTPAEAAHAKAIVEKRAQAWRDEDEENDSLA